MQADALQLIYDVEACRRLIPALLRRVPSYDGPGRRGDHVVVFVEGLHPDRAVSGQLVKVVIRDVVLIVRRRFDLSLPAMTAELEQVQDCGDVAQ